VNGCISEVWPLTLTGMLTGWPLPLLSTATVPPVMPPAVPVEVAVPEPSATLLVGWPATYSEAVEPGPDIFTAPR
jgi:hypothetical protein